MVISKSKINCYFLIVLLVLMLSGTLHADEALIFAVHPYLPIAELIKRFNPLAEYLVGVTGQSVTLRISDDYRSHIDLIGRGDADIAFMGPASYIIMTDQYGRKPLLARLEIKGKPVYKGAIIVHKASNIYELTDLKEKRFAFGDLASTMSHLVPRHMLIDKGIQISEFSSYSHLKTHNNVALSVLAGEFDAGAVKEEVFFKYEKRGLRVIEWTPEISEHVFVAGSELPRKKADALRKALYNLRNTGEGKEIMRGIKGTMSAMVPAKDRDYNNLRQILKALDRKNIRP